MSESVLGDQLTADHPTSENAILPHPHGFRRGPVGVFQVFDEPLGEDGGGRFEPGLWSILGPFPSSGIHGSGTPLYRVQGISREDTLVDLPSLSSKFLISSHTSPWAWARSR